MDDVPGWDFSDGRCPLFLVAMVKVWVFTGYHGDNWSITVCLVISLAQREGEGERERGRGRGEVQTNQ